ncbi:hypothetical protein ABH15_03200 [Methanoculleus taiwanensis]|uniref:Uncharacterized protein n=2 Tax=Methanoculleus taiwanensis TaxID=1550565 RepID=A0A498H2I3_9EURY|nr:hypothetical protein ABH15_03200 [Methanoculleus taiwanensis]
MRTLSMKNRAVTASLLLILLVCTLGASGCTATAPMGDRSLPQITVPADVTLPVTLDPAAVESIEGFIVTAQDMAATWDTDTILYEDKTCTAGFVNEDGDAVTIVTTLYGGEESACAGYTAARERSGYRTFDLAIPDEGYGWQHREAAQVGFRKGTIVVIVDYLSADGPATIGMAQEIAAMANLKL